MSTEKKCPICGEPTNEQYKPFCSKKCADIDLGRWFNGSYAIHTNEAPDDKNNAQNQEDE